MTQQAQTSYMQTGMSVGSAFGPWGTVIGAGVGAVADIASKPASPSSANSSYQNNFGFDNSGWNVAFDGATIGSDAISNNTQGGAQGTNDPYGMAAFAQGTAANSLFGTSETFNDSGWNVAFPGASIKSSAKTTNTQGGAQSTGAKPSIMGSNFSYAVLIIGAVVALKWIKKK